MKNRKETESTIFKEKEWYKEQIVEMVCQIDDEKFLKRIFISIRDYINQ